MNKRVINRLPQLMIGLFLCGMGLGFTIEANLGLNPWDVFHDGFSTVSYTHLTLPTTPVV